MTTTVIKQPEFITYCATKQRVELAISAGATHLILEHSTYSIRSWTSDFNTDPLKHLNELMTYAKTLNKDIKLSIQCDIILHQQDIAGLKPFAVGINQLKPDYIRIQDPGLISFFKLNCPTIKLTYIQEMGNANTQSIQAYAGHTARQQFSLDVTAKAMKQIQNRVNTEFECYVQGPLLIQHSKRRYLAEMDSNKSYDHASIIHRIAQDEDYPGRRFEFYDNPHGHFMFAYFDRCLLRQIPELVDLHCNGWVFDARGQSDEYLATALTLYKNEYHLYLNQKESYALESSKLDQLQLVCKRAQKPGFFKANQTDRQRYNTHLPEDSEYLKIGRVLNIVKGKRLTIELQHDINTTMTLFAFHPKCLGLPIPCNQIWNLNNEVIEQTTGNKLVQLNWVKGIQQHAQVYIKL